MGMRMREDYRSVTGQEKAAILLMSLGRGSGGKAVLASRRRGDQGNLPGHGQPRDGQLERGRAVVRGVRRAGFLDRLAGRLDGQHPAHAVQDPRRGPGRRHHGGNPRSGRPHHVGQARQCERAGSGELSEERISADRGGHSRQDRPVARRQGTGHPAGKLRHGSGHAHAAHRGGEQGHRKGRGAGAAHRVHVQSGAHQPARQP